MFLITRRGRKLSSWVFLEHSLLPGMYKEIHFVNCRLINCPNFLILCLLYSLFLINLFRSTRQVPGYKDAQDALKAEGIDEVMTYCVNDGAVMKVCSAHDVFDCLFFCWKRYFLMRFLFSFHLLSFKAWAEDQKVTDTIIKFYGDPTGAFSKAVDMEMNHPVSCL
jgi:hypothetical protein